MTKAVAKPLIDMMSDDSDDEMCRSNKERDFLAGLISDHASLSTESYWQSLNSGAWISSSVIEFFVKRILQPKADDADKGILFQSPDIYENIKRGDKVNVMGDKIVRKYNVELINAYVHICNTPSHWITVTVSINSREIQCFDSLQPILSLSNNVVLLKFAELYNYIYGFGEEMNWTLKSGLSGERLQNNGIDCGVWSMLFAEGALDDHWSENKLRDCDIEAERIRIRDECSRLFSINEYIKSFQHEGSIYKEPNPESERYMFDAVIKSKMFRYLF